MARAALLAGLLLFSVGCGSSQSPPQMAEATTDSPPAVDVADKPETEPESKVSGYWISRTAKPAANAIIMSLDEPQIESNGGISLPRPKDPDEGLPASQRVTNRGKRAKAKREEYGDGDIGRLGWHKLDAAMAKVLVGRKIERGERAFIHMPTVDFKGRDANVPAGDRRQIAQ
jgi:hypothetical protein